MTKKQEKEEPLGAVGVSVRLPGELVAAIDQLAVQERRSRGNMIRVLLTDALINRAEDEK